MQTPGQPTGLKAGSPAATMASTIATPTSAHAPPDRKARRGLTAASGVEGMPPDDGLVAVRAGGDEGDRHAAEALHARQVVARRLRQALVAAHTERAFLPARHLLVHRHAARERLGAYRQDVA